ncbi:hypothetical protein BJY16_000152 [Actinoplanes octamycinicus]|uniref:Peptidase M12A domain-containing protein n=1 Tax=Actinoplanes octamycinicus TaxID=135948 RepID=A0A7W7GQZ1_9ACTN|nr:Dot/Icm T4SS effector Zinc-dependent metalloprotease LegP [Actinoplanes octamycinicus]MBB4736693.1 hypothetical protein [Actinoplanes octamycinicus]GIE60461.1 hypothetical protein Aoc01nite_58630 [Actinoplanes octamycinicus]
MTQVAEPGPWRSRGEFRGGERGTAMISGVTFRPKPVVFSEINGLAIFEGDIALGTVERLEQQLAEAREQAVAGDIASAVGISGTRFRWPNALIPYEIDPSLPNQRRVTDAIAHWEANTRIRFVARTPANAGQFPDFVRFSDAGGCWSFVGMQGTGAQTISLGGGCSTGNAIHEIGHAIGLWHEQSREDRDMFVRINWANIQPGMEHNFDQHVTDGDDLGGYDYGSIMHYPRTAFSANGQDTIVPLRPDAPIGQRVRLSPGDVAGVHQMYAAILGNGWAGGWSELYSENDQLGSLDVAANADGRLEVFGIGADERIWHTWQTRPGGGWTGGWAELYGDPDRLVTLRAARNADGRLEVFGINSEGRIWHTAQNAPNGAWAGGWAELYSETDRLAGLDVIANQDGRLEVFGVNSEGRIWHTWQGKPGDGWAELFSPVDRLSTLRAARNADGRLEVFGINGEGRIWHTWQVQPGGGWVDGWSELHSEIDRLAMLDVTANADGRLEVFGVNGEGRIWHTWQTSPGGAWNGGWAELYREADRLRTLRAARNRDGRIELFGIDAAGRVQHTWQIRPDTTWIGAWRELHAESDVLTTLAVHPGADGRLELFGLGEKGRIWHTWQL